MGIKVELTRFFDDIEERKSEKEKISVRAGQLLNIMEANIDCISVPVKCNNCSTSNIIIAEDIEMNVEVHERAQGKEAYHHAKGFANCKNCNKDMEVSIDLVEYPEGTITFEDDFIEEVENYSYEKDVEFK